MNKVIKYMHILTERVIRMFINYGDSPKNLPAGYMDKTAPLLINSCGTYRLRAEEALETCRPEGRADYQLIYIAAGRGYFYFDGSEKPTLVEAGNMVLYHPNEYQKYEYYGKDHANICWVHFTGGEIGELFQRYGLDAERKIIPSGTGSFYSLDFDQIMLELQQSKVYFETAAALPFLHVVMSVGRYNRELASGKTLPANEIEDVIAYFREHYQEPIHVERMIESKGYSVSSFFRKFKDHTGLTPLQHLLQIRLSYAAELLETTGLPVNEISCLVGYSNALYFSRLFHKHMGVSPKEYRLSVHALSR